MNIEIAKKGHSFKGAFAYYLHDKGEQTAGRVAWTETRNLALDDPTLARNLMIATARQADALKKAAGVKTTGRKATAGPVYAFSLSWRPDEIDRTDRAEMVRAAEAALKVLKADHLQAMIVCHQDTDHPHVHVVINRVNPANGISEVFSKDRDRLDAWANLYEQERGKIVSPNRARKYEELKKAAPASAKAAFAAHAPPPAKKPPPSPAAMLREHQVAQKERHKQEWADLIAANKARRSAIYAERVDFKAIAAQHRAENKPLWSQLGKDQAAERRAFKAREKRLAGIVRNAIDIVRSQQIRGAGDNRGFLAMCFNYVVSAPARLAAFKAGQEEAKAELARKIAADLIAKFEAVKAARGTKLTQAQTIYLAAREELINRQAEERGKIRTAWQQLYAEGEYKPRPSWRRSAAEPAGASAKKVVSANQPPPEAQPDKWQRLNDLGRLSRQNAKGMAPTRYRGRSLRPE